MQESRQVAIPGRPHRTPTISSPGQKDLVEIIKDLQTRVARLESKINTH